MGRIGYLTAGLLLALAPSLRADGIFGHAPQNLVLAHDFGIEHDVAATKARLYLPRQKLGIGAGSSKAAPRSDLPMGIALVCCVGVGGMWLARLPRRALVSGLLPLALACVIAPVRANMPITSSKFDVRVPPFTTLYKGHVDVYLTDADHARLVLPKR